MKYHYFISAYFLLATVLPTFVAAQTSSCVLISKNLSKGSRGNEVAKLQQFLISQNLLAAGNNTGYFGPLTQSAVQKWQCQHGIVCSGSPSTNGYGAVGPRTRAAMGKCSNTYSPPPITPTYSQSSYAPSYAQTSYYSQGSYVASSTPIDWSKIPTDMSGLVTHMYECALNREPAQSDVSTWVQYFTNHHHAMANVANAFFRGAEYSSRGRSKEQYVSDLYHCILFREPDAVGLNHHVALITNVDTSEAPLIPGITAGQEFITTVFAKLPFLAPNWNGVIDMGEVISAFSDKHPHQAKKRTAFVNTAGTSAFIDDYELERRYGNDVIGIFHSEAGGAWIYDYIVLAADRVGFSGTYPISPSTPCGACVLRWLPMGALSYRLITPNDTGKQIISDWKTYASPSNADAFIFSGDSHGGNDVFEFGVKDFGGTIGRRWYVTIATDLTVDPTATQEFNTFDLGPAEGVYDPEYSQLAYEQRHRTWVSDPNSYAYEYFGDLVNYDPHGSFFNYFSF